MLVRRAQMLNIECIVRGYLTDHPSAELRSCKAAVGSDLARSH